MNTDPLTENQDLPIDRDGVTAEVSDEPVKNVDREVPDRSIDNTPDNLEATSNQPISQDIPPEEITEDASDNSDDHNFKSYQLNQQEIPTNSPQVVNDQVSNTKSFSEIESIPTIDQLKLALRKIVDYFSEEITQINEEKKQLHLDMISLQERMAKLEESIKFKFDGLVKDALKQDDIVWDEDNKECQKYIEQAKLWHSKTEELYTSVVTAIADCGDSINKCGELMQEINKENSTLYKSLLNRYESLEIIKRMLERLREPVESLKKSTLPSKELLRLREQDLVDLLLSQNDEAEAKEILAKEIKETCDKRYKSVREWRDLAEKLEDQWLSFIEKKLLPVLDGIYEGKHHAEHLVDELRPSYQTQICQDKLSAWLKTYVDLENILLETLRNLDINQMSVVRGQLADYERHEPLTTEPDPRLPYESIKEVTRNGYEYKLPDQEQPSILRTAQVIVVKNN